MSDRKISERTKVLMCAKKLISKEEHWTKHASFRTESGHTVIRRLEDIVSYCMSGAIQRAHGWNTPSYDQNAACETYRFIENIMILPIATFNDNHNTTHTDVLRKFDELIGLSLADDQKTEGNHAGTKVFAAANHC